MTMAVKPLFLPADEQNRWVAALISSVDAEEKDAAGGPDSNEAVQPN